MVKKICRIVFFIVIAAAALWLLSYLQNLLLPLLVAAIFAYLLNPLVDFFEAKGNSRLWAVVQVFLLLLSAAAATIILAVPAILEQLGELISNIPLYVKEIQNIQKDWHNLIDRSILPETVRDTINDKLLWAEEKLTAAAQQSINKIISILSDLLELILAPVIAFYLLKDKESIKHYFSNCLPQGLRSDILGLLRDVDEIAGNYIKGNLLVCLVVGVLTGIAMYFLGLKFSFLLGIIAGLTELIPYFGPFIGAVPAVCLALLQPEVLAWQVIVVVLIIQQLENSIISPKILSNSMGLHPLFVIIVIIAGGQLFGVWGMLLAVPAAAILKVAIRYTYLKLVS